MTNKELSVYIETSSNSAPKVETIKNFIDTIKKLNYNTLYLGIADMYELKDEPYFGYMRGRYSDTEFKEVDSYARKNGITLIPSIQTLAHQHFLPLYEEYQGYIDTGHILLAGDERTYKLVDKMFASLRESFSSKRVNIGMDEAMMLGLGQYLNIHGYTDRMKIMLDHLKRVLEIADKYGFTCEMWSDMFFRLVKGSDYEGGKVNVPKEYLNLIPQNVRLNYWDYDTVSVDNCKEMLDKHLALSKNIGFAGGANKWIGFAPANEYSINKGAMSIKALREKGINSFICTLWADNGGEASWYSVLPSLFAFSEFFYGNADSLDNLNKDKFKDLFNISFDDFMNVDKLNNPEFKHLTTINNRCFYYLYNDAFIGIFDSLVDEKANDSYKKLSEILSKNADGKFGYIFNSLSKLALTLSYKANLGNEIYSAYKSNDKEALLKATDKTQKAIDSLDEFFKAFKVQWYKENKGIGFEVQCARIGALKYRLEFVIEELKRFINGEIDKIDTLEVEKMPFAYRKNATADDYTLMCWNSIFTHDFNF